MTTEFTTSVGRIVWGNPAKPQIKKDQQTKQPVMRDGKQVEQWVFGVAFPKAEFEQQVMPYLQQEAASIFPQGFPANFSWKIKDGDGVDLQGKPYGDRDGYAGNYILTVSTEAFSPPIYKNEGGVYRQIEANEIKTGDYVVVSLNVKANVPTNATHTPGLYVNPKGIELVAYGQEIVGFSADPDEMFGGATYALPAGASQTPLVPAAGAVAPYAAPTAPTAPPVAAVPLPQAAVPAAMPASAPQAGMQGNGVQSTLNNGLTVPINASPSNMPPPAYDFVQNVGVAPQPATVGVAPTAAPQPAAMPPMAGIPVGR